MECVIVWMLDSIIYRKYHLSTVRDCMDVRRVLLVFLLARHVYVIILIYQE